MSEELINEERTNIDETNPTDESLTTEEQKQENVDTKIPYDRFKAKVDEANALKERLAKFEAEQSEKERKELEEQNEYKTLYEKALEDAKQAKQEALSVRKNAALVHAGYSEEQVKLLSRLVEGEDEETIAESIKLLQATIPAQDDYADPSALNGAKGKAETIDKEEIGRSAVSRVIHKIKL